ncbi:MAG: ABC transporter substrate-binding protein [Burkholderiaceae bacterium]
MAGVEEAVLGAMLATHGLKTADIELVNVNWSLSPSPMSGQVDAVIGAFRNFELNQMAIEKHPGRCFFPEEEGLPAYDELIYVARRDGFDADRVRRFLAATERATQYIINHPQKSWQVFSGTARELQDELNERAWRDTLSRFALRPFALDIGRYQRFGRFLHEAGLIDGRAGVRAGDRSRVGTMTAGPHTGIVDDWRKQAGPAWQAYVDHAFVRQLGDGIGARGLPALPAPGLRVLMHFARAWALAVVKSDTLDEMTPCAATVHALLHEEMALHVGFCARHGISVDELNDTAEAPANLAYTRYVLEAGLQGDLLDLLAALAPCVFGYGDIGRRLAATSPPDNRYARWIATYAGADYQQVCTSVQALIERAAQRRLGPEPQNSPRWGSLCARFTMACRLEADFWQLGLQG